MSNRLSWRLLRDPVHMLALGFGSGLAPRAPGTAGSLLALLPCWYVLQMPWSWRLAIAVFVFVIGIWICGLSAKRLGAHDHPAIVLDEISAMLTLTLVIPPNVWWLLLSFGLFRVFDITKPWPIRDMDHRLHGGLGIMLDDQMATVYVALCLSIIQHGIATT